jgi:hypothetical protein
MLAPLPLSSTWSELGTSVSDPNPNPHSMGSWIRIQKGENQPKKRRKIKAEDQKKIWKIVRYFLCSHTVF